MSKFETKDWASFDEALSMFELNFRIERDQGIQEYREPLNASFPWCREQSCYGR